jgi:hypothetical protein
VDQADTRTFTFTYQLANGNQASATATFNVRGPTQPNIDATTGQLVLVNTTPIQGHPNLHVERMNFAGPGIRFTLSATPPVPANPGAYFFTQLISVDTDSILDGNGFRVCTANVFNADPGPQLDTFFPYPSVVNTPASTNDSPGISLNLSSDPNNNQINSAEVIRTFSAKMYLMWDPGLNANGVSGCTPAHGVFDPSLPPPGFQITPSNCDGSIPVPLGFVPWSFSSDGINTQYGIPSSQQFSETQTTFVFGCRNNAVNPVFQQSSKIPTWSTSFVFGQGVFDNHTCH